LKILLDHNVDRRFRRHLPGHEVKTAREMRWERLANGAPLQAAAAAAFEALLSVDKNLRHEQNLKTLPIPIVVLDGVSNALPALVPFAPHVMKLLQGPWSRPSTWLRRTAL
jgi:hypothetical protein